MKERKIIYYRDEKNDEFSAAQIKARKIDGNYIYCPETPAKKFTHFFWYRIVAKPAIKCYLKIKFRHKTVNRKALDECRGKGFFIYGNHTQDIADAGMPATVCSPRDVYVIVHANNVSMKGIGLVTRSMGALPLPDGTAAYRNFMAAIEKLIKQNKIVAIYPEAHIWPYYTGIRDFPDTSFEYPVRLQKPVYCFTNTYQKRAHSDKPRMVTYIDGPFYPDMTLDKKARIKDLRDKVYAKMCERAKNSDCIVIEYKKDETNG